MGILRLRCGLGRRVPEVAAVLAAAVGSSRSALRNLGVRGILEVERLGKRSPGVLWLHPYVSTQQAPRFGGQASTMKASSLR